MKDKKGITSYKVRCAECGKEFDVFVPNEYLYRIKKPNEVYDWFCSYRCMHKWKEAHKKDTTLEDIVNSTKEYDKQEAIHEAKIELEVKRRMKEFESN